MAKKKTERKASNFKEAIGLQSILKSERTDFLLGMVIALFAVYTFVALFSYIKCSLRRRIRQQCSNGM